MIKEALTIGYEAGLEDAWECARKIIGLGEPTDVVGCAGLRNFICKYSASEAIELLKEYEEKKEKDYCEGCRYWDKEAKRGCKSPCVEKIKHEEQQKQSKKSCDDCKYAGNPPHAVCGSCVSKNRIEPKQNEENLCADCETCRFADLSAYEFPCSACSASHTFRWEPRKGASE